MCPTAQLHDVLCLPSLGLRVAAADAAQIDPQLRRVLDRDVVAMLRNLQVWGRFARPVDLQIVASVRALAAAAPQPSQLDLRGFAWADTVWLLAPSAWPEPPDDGALTELIVHELAHLLWFQRSTSVGHVPAYVPTWFREGFAVVASTGRPDPRARRNLASHNVIRAAYADDSAIAELGSPCYQIAAHLFAGWHDVFGQRSWTGLCRELRAGRDFAAAFERTCGEPDRAFVQRWADTLHHEAGRT